MYFLLFALKSGLQFA